MKKLQKFISCLCIMSMLICMTSTTVWAEDTNTTTETKVVSVESVQQMVNELPSIQEINDTNRETVIAQLDAIDEAKLQLNDEERMRIDFTKYDAAAFVLSAPDSMAVMEISKTYPETGGPTASISFLNENAMVETMLKDISGGSVSACSSVEPVSNGAATYAYIEAGHYTLNEEVEGEWNASLTVNGQPVEGMEVDFEAGKFYSVNLANMHPETITVSGQITWNDNENQDSKRPDKVTVTLYANGKSNKTVTVTADAGWKYSFTDLSEYDNDWNDITYTVAGDAVAGYSSSKPGKDITYTRSTEISGQITWDDADNQDGKRPSNVTVTLYANGLQIDKTTVTEADGWEYNFIDLAKYADGNEFIYAITGDDVDEYRLTVDGYDIKCTHTPETTAISGEIIWDDANNQDGKRPENVTVTLIADGKETKNQIIVNEEKNWEYSFTDLPKYKSGQKINYMVYESAIEGYSSSNNENEIKYTHTPETIEISGQIRWDDANNQDGKRPDKVEVTLIGMSSNEEYVLRKSTTEANESGGWGYSFTEDVYKYDNGREIVYSISADVDGYISEVNGYNITCTQSTEISGQITWDDADNQDGKRPEQVAVKLVEGGETIERTIGRTIERNVTVTANTDWKYSFKDLPKYRDGREIVYGVNAAVEGYTLTTTGYDIKCTHTPETVDVTGTITWDDAENQDGKRPEGVTVHLYADGNATGQQVTVNAATNWSYSFENLPKFKAGKEISYSIVAGEVEGYTPSVVNYNITYTHMPETTEASGSITWNDADNQEGKRPEQVKVTITGTVDGVVVYSNTIELTEANNWSYSLSNLPKYKNGKEIVYTIKNADVDGYTLKMDENHNFIYSQTEEKIEKPEDKLPTSEKTNKTENETVVSENTNKTVNKQTGASTGDTTDVRSVGVLMGISLIVLLSIFLKKKSMK